MKNNDGNKISGKKTFNFEEITCLCNQLEKDFYYDGDDLGCTYTKDETKFRVWAPTASEVSINLYKEGHGENFIKNISMDKDKSGTWIKVVEEELEGYYYTYLVTIEDTKREAVDPYARTTGVNGQRGMVINLEKTNPKDWNLDQKPSLENITDAVIYELHMRDISCNDASQVKNAGKYLGLTETGTKNKDGESTSLDHIKELGITHLHFLPIFDYASVDESQDISKQFNWGYDPLNYNVPEGSYATDPFHGEVRIKELKEMIKVLHENNFRVVMDVVYNHTYQALGSNLNNIVPYYYYRMKEDGFSNGSACGNEIASEHKMVRKFIKESVCYWAKEYHIDGFRFDLMGLHDIDTMNEVRKALDEIDPTIITYGEGWLGGESTLKEELRATRSNVTKLDRVAMFNDQIRDAIKGNVFEHEECGYVSGELELDNIIKIGVVGSISHPQIDKKSAWSLHPTQSINYVSAHDDLTLWDKLTISCPEDDKVDRIRMNKLSATIIFTSQGVPFFLAGEELLRSKERKDGTFDDNSFQSDDLINNIKWDQKTENVEVYDYYKGLIALRKSYKAFRMAKADDVIKNLTFMDNLPTGVIEYTITQQKENSDKEQTVCVIYNAKKENVVVNLPDGTWKLLVNDTKAGTDVIEVIDCGKVTVNRISAMVLLKAE